MRERIEQGNLGLYFDDVDLINSQTLQNAYITHQGLLLHNADEGMNLHAYLIARRTKRPKADTLVPPFSIDDFLRNLKAVISKDISNPETPFELLLLYKDCLSKPDFVEPGVGYQHKVQQASLQKVLQSINKTIEDRLRTKMLMLQDRLEQYMHREIGMRFFIAPEMPIPKAEKLNSSAFTLKLIPQARYVRYKDEIKLPLPYTEGVSRQFYLDKLAECDTLSPILSVKEENVGNPETVIFEVNHTALMNAEIDVPLTAVCPPENDVDRVKWKTAIVQYMDERVKGGTYTGSRFGYSKDKKLDAAEYLYKALSDRVDPRELLDSKHMGALQQGKLGVAAKAAIAYFQEQVNQAAMKQRL